MRDIETPSRKYGPAARSLRAPSGSLPPEQPTARKTRSDSQESHCPESGTAARCSLSTESASPPCANARAALSNETPDRVAADKPIQRPVAPDSVLPFLSLCVRILREEFPPIRSARILSH